MTENKRIFLNVVATYGRSLYAMIIGLFTARWVLQALGHEDYGLFGVVGGLIGFVGFISSLLTWSVSRFYGVSVGMAKRAGQEDAGLIECQKWFNTALSVHTVVAILIVVIGYPVGAWAVENFLTIPPAKVHACLWVWRFACVSCFVSVVGVPFQAMYTAKQDIAELTIYGFATATAHFGVVYYMVSHPGNWLARYSCWMCIAAVLPQLVIAVRALVKYQECTLIVRYFYNVEKLVELARFALAKFWSNFTSMISRQGQAILVNKFMGPQYNASMTVGNTVSAQAGTLSAALGNAFSPALMNKLGEGDLEKARQFCYTSCRYGSILVLLFAIPLCIEIREVLHLWLVTPPPFAAELCLTVLLCSAMERMTDGLATVIYGEGRGTMRYAWAAGWIGLIMVGLSFLLFVCGCGMWSIIGGLVLSEMSLAVVRLYYGAYFVQLEAKLWINRIFLPIFTVSLCAAVVALIPRLMLPPSFVRIVIVTIAAELVFLPLTWFFLLQQSEREILLMRLRARIASKRG